jgi:hypothetical protein
LDKNDGMNGKLRNVVKINIFNGSKVMNNYIKYDQNNIKCDVIVGNLNIIQRENKLRANLNVQNVLSSNTIVPLILFLWM